jgi:hypothetical protein
MRQTNARCCRRAPPHDANAAPSFLPLYCLYRRSYGFHGTSYKYLTAQVRRRCP